MFHSYVLSRISLSLFSKVFPPFMWLTFLGSGLPFWTGNWNVLPFSITFFKRGWAWVCHLFNFVILSPGCQHLSSPSYLPSLCFNILLFLLRKYLFHYYSVWRLLFYFLFSAIFVLMVKKSGSFSNCSRSFLIPGVNQNLGARGWQAQTFKLLSQVCRHLIILVSCFLT